MAFELGMAAKQYSDAGDPPALETGRGSRRHFPAPHARDMRFVNDVRRMHTLLKTMMVDVLYGVLAKDDGIVEGFVSSGEDVTKAVDAIEEWCKDAAVVAPFIPDTGGVLV